MVLGMSQKQLKVEVFHFFLLHVEELGIGGNVGSSN